MSNTDSWGVVKPGSDEVGELEHTPEKEQTKADMVEELVNKVSKALRECHEDKVDFRKAESNGACALDALYQINDFLCDSELRAKEAKNEVEIVESEQYYFYKEESKTHKITDAGLKALVSKDPKVILAKKNQYQLEAEYSKYKNLYGILNNAHIFFRNLNNNKM